MLPLLPADRATHDMVSCVVVLALHCAVRREVLALMLRYIGAVCGVIYAIILPLMVHVMVVSTHSLVNTGRFVRSHARLVHLHIGRSTSRLIRDADGVVCLARETRILHLLSLCSIRCATG